jgi:fibronectin-binding autotransporter adhesin
MRTMKPTILRLDRLETRLAPAVATWDGGGADNHWTTAANWVGDVAPQPGDDLVFPAGAARLANVNDFPGGTSFHHLAVNGFNYQISGNAIVLTNDLSVEAGAGTTSDVPPVLSLRIIFSGPQSITANSAVTLSGSLSINGGPVTVDNAATVTISGSIGLDQLSPTGLVKTGAGQLFFTGNDNSSAFLIDGTTYFNGTLSGAVDVQGRAVARGAGTIGPLTAENGGTIKPGDGAPSSTPTGHRLTTGFLQVQAGGPATSAGPSGVLDLLIRSFTSDDPAAHDQIVVHGPVRLGGRLKLSTLSPSVGGPLGDGTITIIDNDGTDVVDWYFAGLPEGAIINNVGDKAVRISYKGGDGNDVTLTTVDPTTQPRFAVGAGAGGVPLVNVYAIGNDTSPPGNTAILLRSFLAYDAGFHGGVRVASADFTGDGVTDLVTAPGPGGGPHIRVWDGATGRLVREFMAYDTAFTGGVFVAAGDVNDDGTPDIITGAGPGGGPNVRTFDGKTGALQYSFMAYDPAFTGGVTVAAAKIFEANPAFVITGAGPGGGPHVKVFAANAPQLPLQSFFAFDPAFRGGVTVAAGDTDGDGVADIIVGAGPGGFPQVRSFSFFDGAIGVDFPAYNPAFRGGVTVAAVTVSSLATDIVTGAGPGGGPHVIARSRLDFFAFDPAFLGGVFVG